MKICPDCGGKLIDAAVMDRIIARKEVAFSDHLKAKAKDFEEKFLFDPVLRKKIHADKSPKIACPNCGAKPDRLIGTGSGIIFKGPGFYATDYKNSSSKEKDNKDKAPSAPSCPGDCSSCQASDK